MYDIEIPMVYVEELQDGGRDAYGRYDAMSPMDIIRTVQDASIDMGQEYILILAMGEGGLTPIQMWSPQDPDRYRVQEIYIAALVVEASAIVTFHNIPHGIAVPENDIAFYEEVRDAGDKIGIPLLEHIILNGSMISGISDIPMAVNRWKGLGPVRRRNDRQMSLREGRCTHIESAHLPGTIVGKKKPFTIGI